MKQIAKNPNIEFCYPMGEGKEIGYVRFSGKAKVIQKKETKEKIAKQVPYFKVYWQGLDDPNYTLIRVKTEEVDYMRLGEIEGERFKNK
jgi:general stress protein 26